MRRILALLLLAAAAALLGGLALNAGPARAAAGPAPLPTNAADNLRTGWYPDQPGLAPATVSSSQFGRLWRAGVSGQVYAQPLVHADTLLVATEENWIYGLDPATGAQRWTPRQLGTPFDPADVACADLTPSIGITGTPVVDPASGRAYFAAKSYEPGTRRPRYDLHAIDVATGVPVAGFPVELRGLADNNAAVRFDARLELQRPGLLLLDGVVYVAFGGHCDRIPWQGWIFGVRADSGATTARWIANSSGWDGAGIWQSGGGLVSDGPGRILLTTGNGAAPQTPIPGRTPPHGLGEAIVRLDVGGDGKLRAVDFFAPYDAFQLDGWDADFGSTAPTVLPRPWFGNRRLAVAGGKAGFFYLFDADDLGGIMQGPGGGDRVLQQLGPLGGTWSRFAVWPGDGGWIYYPTASDGTSPSGSSGRLQALEFGTDGDGRPRFSRSGRSSDAFGFGSGAPVISSLGDSSGSALVWIVYAPDGEGWGAELRAYDPVPSGGLLPLRRSFPIGRATKFTPPGIAGGRVFVGTRDGWVHGYGVPASAPLTGSGATFPATVVGSTSAPITVTLTATRALTVQSLSVGGPFTASLSGLPRALAAEEQLTIPVRFRPQAWGLAGGTLSLETSAGPVDVGLGGTAEAASGLLVASVPVVRFGGIVPGASASDAITLANVGATPVTLSPAALPQPPFALAGALPATLARDAKVTLPVTFSPTAIGVYASELELQQSGGEPVVIGLTGSSTTPAHLVLDPPAIDFGALVPGASTSAAFRLRNEGGTPLTITKSKPPVLGPFAPATAGAPSGNPLPEGTVIAAGQSLAVTVAFTPLALGPAHDAWVLNATDDVGGVREVAFDGTGVAAPAPPAPPDPPGGSDRPGGPGGPAPGGGVLPAPPGAPPAGGGAPSRPSTAPLFAGRALRLRPRLQANAAGPAGARVTVRCPAAAAVACRGQLVLRGRPGARGPLAPLGAARFAIAPGRARAIVVPLTRGPRRQLARGRTLRGQAELHGHDAAGRERVTRAPLTLLPPH